MFRIFFIFVALFALNACSGTGTKDYSYVAPEISSEEKGKVFVLRESGVVGSAALVEVSVNGNSVGQLGNGEMLIADAIEGTNYMQVKLGGLGLFMDAPTAEFSNDGNKNHYYVIGLSVGLLKNELTLVETTENSWKTQFK